MEKIIILDFGSQYTQLIARKIRELNVYSEIIPFHAPIEITHNVKGIILSGSPYSVIDKDAPQPNLSSVQGKLPILGICYGAQLLAQYGGGTITAAKTREYGRANLKYVDTESPLFSYIKPNSQVWMSHADTISELPSHFSIIASTHNVNIAAYHLQGENTYGIQFHPEVYHSTDGMQLLENFIVTICGCSQNWTPQSFIEATINDLQQKIGNDKVVLGLSGGVDSSVAAVLLHKAIGTALTCIFVDNGVLRKNEFESVLEQYKVLGLNVIGVNAKDTFLDKLQGVSEPEKKRKIIGNTFIEVFDNEAHKLTNITWLAQGTIYPDVIESISVNGPSATIKSHHNVGGLPDFMKLKIVEPLRLLFKDEVRKIGAALQIPAHILSRHPFPGPGLAIRIIGEVTREKVRILQECDAIFIEGLKSHDLYDKVWQAGVVFLPVQSVGVMGDERTYENCVALRAVNSIDGMTADWVHLPYDFLAKISNEIINNVKGVNRVVYDISSKPPATIEWE
ncbi:MAG: glutamine-hydrolyzing GMP synthase [Bacteroidales bacterium]|nr:glutamine-hydrolyzing GMP synthase [Bacteroidales bacterium]